MKIIITSLIMLVLMLPVYSQSYHTITIDGTNDFNTSYEQMSTTSGTSLYAYVTWDASNIYVGLSGSSPAGTVTDNNRVYHIYIDTDPQTTLTSGNGTATGETWRWQPTLPFNADYHYVFKTIDNSEFKRYYSGGSWADATITTSNWKGSGYWELSLSRSDLGSPSAINLVVYVEEDWSGGNICGGLPSNLFTNTTTSGSIAFNNYWKGYELTSGLNPNGTEFNNRRFISGSETVTTSTSWSGLTILSGGTLTIDVNGALTLDGSLVNRGTSSNVLINSDATGNGSLIYSSGSPDATVQRYFAGYTGSSDGWHTIGSPVDMTVSSSDFVPGTSSPNLDDLYYWDESSNEWKNYKASAFNFTRGQGYLVAYETTATKNFTGTLSSADITYTNMSYTTSSGRKGFHLLGNPYSSAILWNNGGWTFTNVGTVCSVWDESGGSYVNPANGDPIPSTNGFFVEVSGGTNTLTIPASSRSHNTANNYKSTSSNQSNTLSIKVTSNANTLFNKIRIGFNAEATPEWDLKYDAHKLFGLETAPDIWTVSNDENFSVNTLPFNSEPISVPLYFKPGVDGEYQLDFTNIDSFNANSDIMLEDLFAEKSIDLKQNPEYSFTANKGDAQNRFVLHFYNVTSTPEITPVNNLALIYTSLNSIIIKSLENNLNGTVSVIDMLGQTVYSNRVEGSNFIAIKNSFKSGIYIIRYQQYDGTTQTDKVILR